MILAYSDCLRFLPALICFSIFSEYRPTYVQVFMVRPDLPARKAPEDQLAIQVKQVPPIYKFRR